MGLLYLLTLALLLDCITGAVAGGFQLGQTLLFGSLGGFDFCDSHSSI
jgi:hypothetical protein